MLMLPGREKSCATSICALHKLGPEFLALLFIVLRDGQKQPGDDGEVVREVAGDRGEKAAAPQHDHGVENSGGPRVGVQVAIDREGEEDPMNDQTREHVQEKAQEVKQKLSDKTHEAAEAAKEKAGETFDRQKGRAVSEIDRVCDALRRTCDDLRQQNGSAVSVEVLGRLADGLERFSNNLEGKSLEEVLQNVEQFGRRSPAVLLGSAAAAGFLTARFLKSSGRQTGRSTHLARRSDIAGEAPTVGYAEER